jgi:hypothetical protein
MPIDVVLYMHIKEFGRRSNTGMLAASQVKSKGGSLESVKVKSQIQPNEKMHHPSHSHALGIKGIQTEDAHHSMTTAAVYGAGLLRPTY